MRSVWWAIQPQARPLMPWHVARRGMALEIGPARVADAAASAEHQAHDCLIDTVALGHFGHRHLGAVHAADVFAEQRPVMSVSDEVAERPGLRLSPAGIDVRPACVAAGTTRMPHDPIDIEPGREAAAAPQSPGARGAHSRASGTANRGRTRPRRAGPPSRKVLAAVAPFPSRGGNVTRTFGVCYGAKF